MSLYDEASLVMIPSGYKEDKLYSIKPTSGDGDFTFSRGTDTATRVNASGLIEKERGNLVLQSNSFSTSPFLTSNVSVTSGQAGYDGTNDAWELSTTGVNGFENLYQNISFTGVHTISVYAKAGSKAYLTIRSLTSDFRVEFKLDDGTHRTIFGSPINTFMDDAGNGWYRCGFTANFSSASALVFYPQQIGIVDAGNIYIQDAQLEKGLVATDYIETTTSAVYEGITDNLPRLDYSGGASCPSLLLEPQRTNIHTNSEYVDAYVKSRSTITTNAAISPEGVQNASKVVPLSTSNGWAGVNAPNYSFTSGQTYTLSVFAKAGEYDYCQVGGSTPAFSGSFATINLTNGVVEHQSGITASTEDYGSGWYRISFTHTAIATASSPIGFFAVYSTAVSSRLATQVGDDVSGVYMYGWQAEQGSYPTSYIPTYGTSATRAAEENVNVQNLNTNGVTTANSAYSLFFDLSAEPVLDVADGNSLILNSYNAQNLSSSYITLTKYYQDADGKIRFISNIDSSTIGYVTSTNKKFAMVVNGTTIKVFTDGGLELTYTATNNHNGIGSLKISNGSSNRTSSNYSQVLLFDSVLTDAEAIALTTL